MFWIYFFLVTLFIRPQDWTGSPIYGWPLNDFIVLGGLFFGFMRTQREKIQIKDPQIRLLALFAGLAFLSNAANGDITSGTEQFILILKRFLVFLMFLLLVDTPQKIRQTLFFSVMLTVILVFQGMYQKVTGIGWAQQQLNSVAGFMEQSSLAGFDEYGARTFWIGLWDGPNVLAIAYLFAIPFCLVNMFKSGVQIFARMVYIVSFVLLNYGIYLTNSRGGFLAVVFTIVAFVMLRFSKVKAIAAFLVIVPVFLALAPPRAKILDSKEESAHERTWLWEQGLNMARAKPLFGIGKGNFSKTAGLIAHSNYVGNMGEMGLPGLAVYITLLYWPVKCLYMILTKTANIPGESELLSLSQIMLITLLGFAVATAFVIMEHDILYVLWALSLSVIWKARREIKDINIRFGIRDCIGIGCLCLLFVFALWLFAIKEII